MRSTDTLKQIGIATLPAGSRDCVELHPYIYIFLNPTSSVALSRSSEERPLLAKMELLIAPKSDLHFLIAYITTEIEEKEEDGEDDKKESTSKLLLVTLIRHSTYSLPADSHT